MRNSKAIYFLAALVGLAAFTGAFLYTQGGGTGPAQAMDSSSELSLISPVPEAESVHEGTRQAIPIDHEGPIAMKVYASPTCGCCGFWVEHVQEHGFEVEEEHRADMGEVKRALGVEPRLSSCHTAVVGDYVIEGHVPAADVRRLLAEAPSVRGLTVPGMPVGSPGMEVPSGEVDEYQVLTFTSDGELTVFAEYGPGEAGQE